MRRGLLGQEGMKEWSSQRKEHVQGSCGGVNKARIKDRWARVGATERVMGNPGGEEVTR